MSIQINDKTALVAKRELGQAMLRGTLYRCPNCGDGKLFSSYLKVSDSCTNCGEELHHHRADDAPPYFTIFIVGHFIVGGILAMEQAFKPSALTHALVWVPLTILASLWLLPRIKGMMVGLQWALRMHGFGGPDGDVATTGAKTDAPVRQTTGN